MPRVAVLHTSFVFVSVEPAINDLIAELLPDAEVIHFVDSDVLATVIKEQGISPASEVRMTRLAEAAEAAGADIIFSACSSLGPSLDVAAEHVSIPVLKIDEPMAIEAVTRASRIGVLATVPTTLGPTSDLLKQKAEELGREVEVRQHLCEGAFDVLMSGDRKRHDDIVSEQATELAQDVELIVLAQASMNRLSDRLAGQTGIPVLSSPRSGVTELAKRVTELSA